MKTEKVKLVIYTRYEGSTQIDEFEAQDWGEFVIAKVSEDHFTHERAQEFADTLSSVMPGKKVVVVPDSVVVELFGVKEISETDADE